MAFAISGRDGGHILSAARTRAAGALVLADRWALSGFSEIRIDWNGRSYDIDAFRKLLVFTVGGLKPRGMEGPLSRRL